MPKEFDPNTAVPIPGGGVYQNYGIHRQPFLTPATASPRSSMPNEGAGDGGSLASVLAQRAGMTPQAASDTVTATTPEQQAVAQATPSIDGSFDPTALLGTAGGAAAAYALYKVLQGRAKQPSGMNAQGFGANRQGQMSGPNAKEQPTLEDVTRNRLSAPDNIIDGEWSEVAPTRQVTGPQARLNGPQPVAEEAAALAPDNIKMYPTLKEVVAGTRSKQLARKKSGVLQGLQDRTSNVIDRNSYRAPDLQGVDSELAKVLKSNPKLIRTLIRGL